MTRKNILQKRIDTGYAEYHGKNIFNLSFYSDDNVGLYVKGYELYEVSIHDILFGPSNFFEFMSEHLEPTMEVTMVCNELGIGWELGHKMCCAIAEDKLKYLVDNLPK